MASTISCLMCPEIRHKWNYSTPNKKHWQCLIQFMKKDAIFQIENKTCSIGDFFEQVVPSCWWEFHRRTGIGGDLYYYYGILLM